MKVAICKPTEELKKMVEKTTQFSNYIELQSFDEIIKDRKIEVLMTEKGEFTAPDVIHLRAQFPSHKILLLAETIDPFFAKTCLAHDVLLLDKHMEEHVLLNQIQKEWFGLEEQTEFQNVVALHGTHRQVGVTQTALSIANVLGSFNLKTIVIGLNPYNPGEIYDMSSTYSFDQIYDLLESDVIRDGNDLLPYLLKLEHFYYLVGNRDFYKALRFEGKPIEKLIYLAKNYFDVVLLDLGAFYDGFHAKTGLELSNTHILISSQESISIEEYNRWKEQVIKRFDLHPKSSYQIVNKMASRAIITPRQLKEAHRLDILAQIPYFPEAADAVIDSGILGLASYKPYIKSIEGIAKAIEDEVLEDSRAESRNKFFSFLGKGRV